MCDNCHPMKDTCKVCNCKTFTCVSCLAFNKESAEKSLKDLANPSDNMIDWLCKSCYVSTWGPYHEKRI